jgi:hypothetical protein
MERIKRLSHEDVNGCWVWDGTFDKGSPILRLSKPRRLYPARRYAYERWNQITLPAGYVAASTCGHRFCVNPRHMAAVKKGQRPKGPRAFGRPDYCQRGHEFTEWNTRRQSLDRVGRLCLACHRIRNTKNMARYRSEDPTHQARVRRARLARRKAYVVSQKVACILCGEADAVCLDFHHRDSDGKHMTISQAMRGPSFERLKLEIAKCDVLCANCHRRLHHGDAAAMTD